jgi:hypothetical protein
LLYYIKVDLLPAGGYAFDPAELAAVGQYQFFAFKGFEQFFEGDVIVLKCVFYLRQFIDPFTGFLLSERILIGYILTRGAAFWQLTGIK